MEILIGIITITIAGIGAQWLAWRMQLPAIVLMLVAGIFVGPVTNIVQPDAMFGDMLKPLIGIAVALILFEGGLTLDFARLSDAETAVRRLVLFGGPLIWLFASAAGYFIGGLDIATATVFGGILVVTGPTVVIPLLRQAGLKRRPAEVLKWEAIVNDPVGALAGVLAYEVATVFYQNHSISDAFGQLVIGIFLASVSGYLGAKFLISGFNRGLIPEYLKVPIMISLVVVVYGATDLVLHESGLLAVTIMGIIVGNAHLPSLSELRRFKEHVTVMLVTGVFIILAAKLDFATLAALDWRAYVFIFVLVFLVRPVAVMLALVGSNLNVKEQIFVGWIGPRGVVAVAVSGVFGENLLSLGLDDGALLAPLSFVIVTVTVFLHGFSIGPFARALDLVSSRSRGFLLIGTNPFTFELAKALKKLDRPALIVDKNWFRLKEFRQNDIDVYYGEVLSEEAEHDIDHNVYENLYALTDNDHYNALVCADFGPEFGRNHVMQFAPHKDTPAARQLPSTLGGRYLPNLTSYEDAMGILAQGGQIRVTPISENFTFQDYQEHNPKAIALFAAPEKGALRVFRNGGEMSVHAGEKIVALIPKLDT